MSGGDQLAPKIVWLDFKLRQGRSQSAERKMTPNLVAGCSSYRASIVGSTSRFRTFDAEWECRPAGRNYESKYVNLGRLQKLM